MEKEKPKVKKLTEKQKLKQTINKLELESQDIAVKILNMDLIRGSEEHLILRKQLYEVQEQLEELGARKTKLTSRDEMKEAAERGEKKRKETKKKKESTKDSYKF